MKVLTQSVLRIPEKCAIMARSFEISRESVSSGYDHDTSIGLVEKVIIHSIEKSNKNRDTNELPFNLAPLNNTFDENNNMTKNLLKTVKVDTFTKTETLLIASSGSLTVLVVSIITFVLTVYIAKSCKKKVSAKNEPFVVVVDNAVNKKRGEDEMIEDNSVDEKVRNGGAREEDVELAKRHLDDMNKRPPFQRKL